MKSRLTTRGLAIAVLCAAACVDPAALQVQIASDLPTSFVRMPGRAEPFELVGVTVDVTAFGASERVLDDRLDGVVGSVYLHTVSLQEADYPVDLPLAIEVHAVTAGKGELERSFEVALSRGQLLRLDAYVARKCFAGPPTCAATESCGRDGACESTAAVLTEVPRHGVPFH